MKRLVILLGLTALLPQQARPCSRPLPSTLVEASFTPDTTGPEPLLIGSFGARLTDEAGNVIEVVTDERFASVQDWLYAKVGHRPAAPLAPGSYQWEGKTFTVEPDRVVVLPSLSDATFTLVIDRAEEASGCEELPCAPIDMSRLEVDFIARDAPALVAIEVTRPTSGLRTVYVGRAPGGAQHDIDIRFATRERTCVALYPLGGGDVGERLDLGCADPKTGENFTDLDAEGCASTQTTNAWAMFAALMALVHRRVRHPSCGTP